MEIDLRDLCRVVARRLEGRFPHVPPQRVRQAVELATEAGLGDSGAAKMIRGMRSDAARQLVGAARALLRTEPGYWLAFFAIDAADHPLPEHHPAAGHVAHGFGVPILSVGHEGPAPRGGHGGGGHAVRGRHHHHHGPHPRDPRLRGDGGDPRLASYDDDGGGWDLAEACCPSCSTGLLCEATCPGPDAPMGFPAHEMEGIAPGARTMTATGGTRTGGARRGSRP